VTACFAAMSPSFAATSPSSLSRRHQVLSPRHQVLCRDVTKFCRHVTKLPYASVGIGHSVTHQPQTLSRRHQIAFCQSVTLQHQVLSRRHQVVLCQCWRMSFGHALAPNFVATSPSCYAIWSRISTKFFAATSPNCLMPFGHSSAPSSLPRRHQVFPCHSVTL
jgi:hypothetical protein